MNKKVLKTILEKMGHDTDEKIELTIDELFEIVEAFNGQDNSPRGLPWTIPADSGGNDSYCPSPPWDDDISITCKSQ